MVIRKLYGLYMKENAEPYFKEHNAYGGQWDSLPQTFRDALLVTYTNWGEERMKESIKFPYEPQPALTTGGGVNHLFNAANIGAALGINGYGNDVKVVDDFVEGACLDGEIGLSYRYALLKLRYVVVDGVDYSALNVNGELTLSDDGGQITKEWILDRSNTLNAWVNNELGTNHPTFGFEWEDDIEITDMVSGKNIVIDNGWGSDKHYIIFGDQTGKTLKGGDLDDHLYGMAGDDILEGGGGNDYLEGGNGNDTYKLISGGLATIRDIDGNGVIQYEA